MARHKKTSTSSVADWRNIADDREKYNAYLCSREWSVKKEAVKERCGGICERCGALPVGHVHHLTYSRKYNEELEDLQGRCKPCHEFEHGKSDFDPSRWSPLLRWLTDAKERPPMPRELFMGLIDETLLESGIAQCVRGVRMLYAAGFYIAADKLEGTLPFRLHSSWILHGAMLGHEDAIDKCYKLTVSQESREWFDYGSDEPLD